MSGGQGRLRRIQNVQLVDIGMKDTVDKADAGTLIRILIWKLNMDLPQTAGEGSFEQY